MRWRTHTPLPTDRQYTGQRWDADLGLYDYKARYYDPTLARFIQPDTVVPEPGDPQALNRYAYVLNNPLRYNDPSGHWLDTLIDIASIVYDVHDIATNGLNWENGLSLAADVVSLALPVVTGGGVFVRAATHADEVADAVRVVSHADEAADAARILSHADEAGDVLEAAERVDDVSDWGVFFFDEQVLPYIDSPDATLGREGMPHFFMPLEDAASIRTSADAARQTGMAPSVVRAYVNGKPVYGVAFPTGGLDIRLPTAADAGGWPHFLEGGRTAVRTAEPNGGYLLNTTREFVVHGGSPMPTGSVLFRLGSHGEWIPLRRWLR